MTCSKSYSNIYGSPSLMFLSHRASCHLATPGASARAYSPSRREGSSRKPSHSVYTASCMSIRPVLRAVTRPGTESTERSILEDQTRHTRLSGGYRIAAVSLKGLGFMQREEFPANLVLGNSEGIQKSRSCLE